MTILKFDNKFRFPLAEGALKQPGGSEKSRVKRRKRRKAPAEPGESVEEDEDEEEEEEAPQDQDQDESPEREISKDVEEPFDPDVDPDYWTFSGTTLTIHHLQMRSSLFVPTVLLLKIALCL